MKMKKINLYLFEYAINYIFRHKAKNLFIFLVLTFMSALLASVLFISNSLKYELQQGVDGLSDIIVQNTQAGMYRTIDSGFLDEILNIEGVKDAQARVWGYYYFPLAKVNFVLIGVDSLISEESWTPFSFFRKLTKDIPFFIQ